MSVGFKESRFQGVKGNAEGFLNIAYGSVYELETQIMLSGDLSYLNGNQLSKLQKEVVEVERMLQALIKSLENKPLKP